MKGIILAGGKATRLYPSTLGTSKQLLPIYDKPMIYYPLSTMMLSGIKDILIISTAEFLDSYKFILGDGKQLGINITYAIQEKPKGLAEAFIIGEEFIGQDSVCLILGDNLFYGHELIDKLRKASTQESGGTIFGYRVDNPSQYGVLEFDSNLSVLGVEEKPKQPKSEYAIPGIYFFDNKCIEYAKNVIPSDRGELEITDIIQQYINKKTIKVELLGRGITWLDTGTHDNLMEASTYVQVIEKRQGLKIACIEEVAYNMGFIDLHQLDNIAKRTQKSSYGQYLKKLVKSASENKLNYANLLMY